MVRNCLKEPFKTKALQREHAYYKLQSYADGAAQKAGASLVLSLCSDHFP
jgi:F-type H+-transporting ATPase subunit epsilon